MTDKMVTKDERTTFIQNVSYRFGYNFISFALLFDVIYRGLRFNEASWDLLAVVIISGLVMTIYQYKQRILEKAWVKTIILTLVISLVLAFILALILKRFLS